MKSSFLALVLLLATVQTFSQTKYYIYLKDKGIEESGVLSKTMSAFQAAEKELSPAAIERRKQVMGDNYITEEDVPINEKYVKTIEASGIKIENKLKWFNAVTAYLTDAQAEEIMSLPFVSRLEMVRVTTYVKPVQSSEPAPDNSLKKTGSAASLNYGPSLTQYNLSEVPVVHDLGITGKGVIIGILDTGFRWKTHPALKNLKIIGEKDFVQKDDVTENQAGDAADQDSHGTNCLGLMAGNDPGNLIGPSFDASIIIAKTENVSSETLAEEDNYVAALQWMEGFGVQITTSSLGYNQFDNNIGSYTFSNFDGKTTITAKALNLLFSRGVFTLTAAGNERGNSWGKIITPADAFNVVAVGAVSSSNQIASFSSPGPTSDGRIKPEIVAMGVTDYISKPYDAAKPSNPVYGYGNGTSYATPISAGIAGLLKSCWPHLTNVQMRKMFLECGDNTAAPNNDRGYGLISAKKLISYPNLQLVNDQYQINKIFINSGGVNSSTIKLNYKVGTGSFQKVSMNYDGTLKYNYLLPSSANGTAIEIYFEYNNTAGTAVREPASTNYKISYGDLAVNNILTAINAAPGIPADYKLYQNYPNPFNPTTTINYSVPVAAGNVTLKIYDLLGREVASLVNENLSSGNYQVKFDASSLVSGFYFYRLQAGSFSETKKMLLVK